MNISIRSPSDADRGDWERLYRGYADFYQVPMNDRILQVVWDWIFDPGRPFYCIMATRAGAGVGLMHYRAMPSPLRGAEVGFLDDLYVEPDARGGGVVNRLFEELASQARQHGWPVIRWITRDNNYRARSVYDRVATRTDWITYELNPGS
ncbi:MAG: GNAT family N-acetyltransferase [Gammaproteobacteria bacterium]|nr:GNAT family N-acetyltransferase [Gammaproteobacteria bacterium]